MMKLLLNSKRITLRGEKSQRVRLVIGGTMRDVPAKEKQEDWSNNFTPPWTSGGGGVLYHRDGL